MAIKIVPRKKRMASRKLLVVVNRPICIATINLVFRIWTVMRNRKTKFSISCRIQSRTCLLPRITR